MRFVPLANSASELPDNDQPADSLKRAGQAVVQDNHCAWKDGLLPMDLCRCIIDMTT